MLEIWQGFIAWEIEMGHINEVRSLYKRCFHRSFAWTASELWFEEEYGLRNDCDLANQKVSPRLEELEAALELFQTEQENKNIGEVTNERENFSEKNSREKRNATSSAIDEQSTLRVKKI